MSSPHDDVVEALRSGDPERALDLCKAAIRDTPHDAELYGLAGVALGQLGLLEQAVASFQHAVELDPESSGLHYNLGRALEKSGHQDDALAAYRAALALAPDHKGASKAVARLSGPSSSGAPFPPAAAARATPVRKPPARESSGPGVPLLPLAAPPSDTPQLVAASAALARPKPPRPSRRPAVLAWIFGVTTLALGIAVAVLALALFHSKNPSPTGGGSVALPPAPHTDTPVVTVQPETKASDAPQDVIARVKASVVLVLAQRTDGVYSGSGFPVDGERVATCAHVVDGADKIEVLTPDGNRLDATVCGTDAANDLVLLKCAGTLPPALKLGDVDAAREGDPVAITGYPVIDRFQEEGYKPESSSSQGTISGKPVRTTPQGNIQQLQTDAAVNAGDSGGPLYSVRSGDVLGVVASRFSDQTGISFAASVAPLRSLLTAPVAGGPDATSASPSGPAASPAAGSPPAKRSFALFAVDGTGVLEPIVVSKEGTLSEPSAGVLDSGDASGFSDTYYHPGATYHVLFGGADAGTVQVAQANASEGGGLPTAKGTLHTSAPLRGRIEALATDADTLAAPQRSRRAATSEERRQALRLATEFFRQQGIPSLLEVLPVNLTAMELTTDHQEALIGSFQVISGSQQANLFAIFERKTGVWITAFTAYYPGKDPGGADREQELLIDRADLTGDGTAEVVTVSRVRDGNRYRIYGRKEGRWGSVYTSSVSHARSGAGNP